MEKLPATFTVRDTRHKENFVVDDAYLNGYAKLCGWQASLVYFSLCRHANKEQSCYPSLTLLMEELAISKNSVLVGIKSLVDWGIIQIEKTVRNNGGYGSNIYILLDKSKWNPKPVPPSSPREPPLVRHVNHPSSPDELALVRHVNPKVSHKKDIRTPLCIPPLKKYSSPETISLEDIRGIAARYQVTIGFVNLQLEKMKNYCESSGRTYKNYLSALRNFVLGDMQKNIERRSNDKYRPVDARNL